MTTPAYGQPISISDVSTETGGPGTQSASISWINGFTKTAIGGPVGTTNLNDTHSKVYYQNMSRGQCNNGNCTTAAPSSPGPDKQCVNCYNTAINCNNCDTTKYLQPYEVGTVCNCTSNQYTYNCNCDCNCQCDILNIVDCWCACW